jgi:hypothetical protein
MDKDAKRETHPAYGLIGISRWTAGGARSRGAYRLFGSSVDNHSGISLEIKRAEVYHDLGSDHYFDLGNIIEVEMSESQFATMITTMNSGPGTPCTIRAVDGKPVEKLPNVPMETEKIRQNFAAKMAKWRKQFDAMGAEIDELMKKKSLLAADKVRIKDLTSQIAAEMQNNVVFLMDQFNASADDVVAQCKAEIAGFIDGAVRRTGLEQIRQHGVGLLEHKGGPDANP